MSFQLFLNRLLGLELAAQEALLAYFTTVMEGKIQAAKKEGTYDEGVQELKGGWMCRVGITHARATVGAWWRLSEGCEAWGWSCA